MNKGIHGDLTASSWPRIPSWTWWGIVLLGTLVQATFLFRGNIAFNGDVIIVSRWVESLYRTGMVGKETLLDFSSLRIWVGLLFYRLTHGWVYFGSLASVFINFASLAVFVFWVHQNLSRISALFLALFLSLPPFCTAYFWTNYETRMETTLYAGLLALLSVNLFRAPWRLVAFFGLTGFAFWGEPFILFFALPMIWFESRKEGRRSISTSRSLGSVGMGLLLGSVMGFFLNRSLSHLAPGYIHLGIAGLDGIQKNCGLFFQVFPQYWSGNFPLGYLQASVLGLKSFPMEPGWFGSFLWVWWYLLAGFSSAGYFFFSKAGQRFKDRGFIVWVPSALFILFFIFSAQIWDATSLRYLSFLVIGIGVGLGMGIEVVLRRDRRAGILLFAAILVVQAGILGKRIRKLPTEYPALKVVEVLNKLDFKLAWGNHWVSTPGAFLSHGQLKFLGFETLLKGEGDPRDLSEPRIALTYLEGLDQPEFFSEVVRFLEGAGYQPCREWPMLDGWTILEFRKSPSGSRKPTPFARTGVQG